MTDALPSPDHLKDLAAKARDAVAGVLLSIENQAAEIDRLRVELARQIDAYEELEDSVIGLGSLRAQLGNIQRYCVKNRIDYQAIGAGNFG